MTINQHPSARVEPGVRLVAGRRAHDPSLRRGEQKVVVAGPGLGSVSRRWFTVEEIPVPPTPETVDRGSEARITCSGQQTRGIRVWDHAGPVPVLPGSAYLLQGSGAFVGEILEGGEVVGMHVTLLSAPAKTKEKAGETDLIVAVKQQERPDIRIPDSDGTPPPRRLTFEPMERDVLIARYHGYYRLPGPIGTHPWTTFNPRPQAWAALAQFFGLTQKTLQEYERNARQRVCERYPQVPRAEGPGDRTFHDWLRAALEQEGLLTYELLDDFDRRRKRPD